jgi:cytochrome c-type biogenesis protein CcmH
MTMFFLLAALMLIAALAFVLVPLLRHGRGRSSRPLRALDEALAAGVIDVDEHARKRASLGAAATTVAPPSRTTFVALLLVALLLPASALLLYRLVGAPQALDPATLSAPPTAAGESGPDMEQAIALLAARLEAKPDDAEGWALLGRAYQSTNRADEALAAFKRAHEVAPDNAALTVEYAQALAMARPDHRIEGESRNLLEGVLQADAGNQRALWLLGISDYQAQRYDEAIVRWKVLLPLLEAGSTVQASVKNQIAEAEALRDGKAPQQGIAADAAPTTAPETVAPTADAPRLTVKVTLDPKLKDQFDPDATLFVFARAASGPPMPLAIERLKASALPLTVTLDESKGMLPNMKLSMFPQVVIGARVSKSGNAIAQSGDLQVLSPPVDVGRKDEIALTIDQVVP